MGILEVFLIGIGLSMDAFAVSICKGLSMKKLTVRQSLIVGTYFGVFQALMPLIGFALGRGFQNRIESVDHWIAFILLVLIGANMVKESLSKEEETEDASLEFKSMVVLAIATSIDALAVGVSFAFLKVNIISSVIIIGITTFVLCILGVKVGNVFGVKYKAKAELVGGVILIVMGLRILVSHLMG